MARTESATLRVSLIDGISANARKAAGGIQGIGDAARSVSGTLTGRLDRAIATNQRNLDQLRGRLLDSAAAGYGLYRAFKAPVEAFATFESKLEDIAQKIDKPRALLPKLGAEIRAIARDTTNLSQNIAEGFDILAGMGASEGDTIGMLPAIGKAAVAYRAQIADLSNAGYAALDNLKVPVNEFGKALDVMAQAGKAGAFELRDMATYFPQLGAAYQGLKQHGVPAVADLAAALQVVRKGTGDASSAATNLNNVLQKIYAPATLKKFGELGVNLRKEMAKAAKAGMTPIEAIAEITNKALKGDLSRLGELFEDAQVQAGLRPLIQNMEEYRKIRAEALAAQGVVEADYQERLKTGAMAGQRFAVAMESINIAVGSALMPALADLANALVPIINSFAKFAENNPGLTRALVGSAAAVVGLNVALTAARFGGLFLFGGLLKLAKGGLVAGTALAKVGGYMGGLLGFGRRAAVELPASLEGFGRGSQALTRNARAATDASRRMVEGMGAARQASDRMIAGMSDVATRAPVAGFTSFGQRAAGGIVTGMRGVLTAGTLLSFVPEIIADLQRTTEERLAWMRANGEAYRKLSTDLDNSSAGQWWKSLQTSARQVIDDIVKWFSELPGRIASAIGSIDISSLIKWPSLPDWLRGSGATVGDGGIGNRLRPPAADGTAAPATTTAPGRSRYKINGARASGGSVYAGGTYRINEFGQEFFTPEQNGTVHPAGHAPVSPAIFQPSRDRGLVQATPAPVAAAAPQPPARERPNVGPIHFHINGSSQDAQDIAESVMTELSGVFGDYGLDF